MNIYNWLLLAVPIVGVVGVLLAIRMLNGSFDASHWLHPGE